MHPTLKKDRHLEGGLQNRRDFIVNSPGLTVTYGDSAFSAKSLFDVLPATHLGWHLPFCVSVLCRRLYCSDGHAPSMTADHHAE
jgi:hypothetical protein